MDPKAYLIDNVLNKNSVVIDIGAYQGNMSKSWIKASHGNPKKYHLIEPCPDNFKVLAEACKACNCHHLAIADKVGSKTFYTVHKPNNTGSSQANSFYKSFTYSKDWGDEYGECQVHTETMDSFFALNQIKHATLVKMNCEGGEYDIFKAKTFDWLKKIDWLLIQLHGKHPIFLNKTRVIAKIQINALLCQSNFELIIGPHPRNLVTEKGHITQLWRRKK